MKEVSAMAKKLQGEGYDFTLEENPDEYVVMHDKKEYHFAKLELFPLGGGSGATRWLSLADAMEERIRKGIRLGE